jgi:transketolase
MTQFVQQAYDRPGPVYIRLGRGNDPVIYDDDQVIEIGTAITARDGSDVTIIACGTIMREALRASEKLEKDGISTRVVDMHTLKPLDAESVLTAARETGHIVTAEDHTVIGGLGTAVAEVLADAGVTCRLTRLGVPDVFALVGPPKDLYRHYGFDSEGIATAVRASLRK